jgi:hypothetical protein
MYTDTKTNGRFPPNSDQLPIPNAAYGPSKAAANWFIVRINAEEPWLHSFGMDPALVKTDLGRAGADRLGLTEEILVSMGIDYITADEACDAMVTILSTTSKQKHGGRLLTWKGEISAW